MNGAIFAEQLKQSWRQMLYWGIGLGMLSFYILAVLEDPEVIGAYNELLSSMPPALLSAFGLTDAALLTTPEGFIAFAGFTYGGLALAVFGMLSGLNIITNDEDSGMMNIILSLPTARWQVIIERYLAFALILIGIVTILFAGIVAGAIVFTVELDMMLMLMGTVNLLPATLAIMAITALIGSVFSNKLIVTGLAAGFVLVSYVLDIIAGAVNPSDMPVAEWVGAISVFKYLDSEAVILDETLNMLNISVLLALAIVSILVSLYAFENRDIRG